ncbi:MAG: ABC transporter ATP-binding protein [Miltoncostaeaceae bacterium]
MSGEAVRARGLRKHYGAMAAVDGIDLDVAPGECFGFLGPNGAGKTTTMRMLSCLARRDEGELAVLGLDPDRSPRELKRMLGVVAQDTTLDVELGVRQNLLVWARYFDIPRAEAAARADELLALMALTERAGSPVASLSGGMQRRLQIARALINRPRMVLLDEPTTGLDPQARHAVWDRLRALRAEGATLVITTHYMDEAARLCDRLVVIDGGRIVRAGTPAGLVAAEVGREVVELRVAPADMAAMVAATEATLRAHQSHDDLLLLFTDDAEATWDAVRGAGVAHRREAVRAAGLEDVFLALTGRVLRD